MQTDTPLPVHSGRCHATAEHLGCSRSKLKSVMSIKAHTRVGRLSIIIKGMGSISVMVCHICHILK